MHYFRIITLKHGNYRTLLILKSIANFQYSSSVSLMLVIPALVQNNLSSETGRLCMDCVKLPETKSGKS